jgi:hypothetical protein
VLKVAGMYGDGSVDGTCVRINDPWGRNAATPGNPGLYDSTPGRAGQFAFTLTQFTREYEAAADHDTVNTQILHANGAS